MPRQSSTMILTHRPPKVSSVSEGGQASFISAFKVCRRQTLDLVADVQSALIKQQAHPDFSPVGWHLGHITYTEALWLTEHSANPLDQLSLRYPIQYRQLFSADGLPKAKREDLPDLGEILAYLENVRENTLYHLSKAPLETNPALLYWLLQHESQHAETIAIVLALHALKKAEPENTYLLKESLNNRNNLLPHHLTDSLEETMVQIKAGSFIQGCDEPFALDNEKPAHSVWLNDYWIDRRPVTCQQYHHFIEAGGYHQKKWWTTAGWRWKQLMSVEQPLYWPICKRDEGENEGTFGNRFGNCPVHGVSWYEADAYARFVGKRLPSESEWAKAASDDTFGCEYMLGNVWQWTSTWFDAYSGFESFPYAGYSQAYFDGAHRVLRGGSWATPQWALRKSFRNWYHPHRREMFAGFRCAA